MAFNPMQQQQSPDMLMAMMTDPRATPQQRMAAMSALNTMRGGANAPQPPQMTGDGTGVSDMDPAFMAAVRQEMMGQGPEEQPEIPQRQAAPEAPQNPATAALMSGAADAARVAAMAQGGAVKGYYPGGKVIGQDGLPPDPNELLRIATTAIDPITRFRAKAALRAMSGQAAPTARASSERLKALVPESENDTSILQAQGLSLPLNTSLKERMRQRAEGEAYRSQLRESENIAAKRGVELPAGVDPEFNAAESTLTKSPLEPLTSLQGFDPAKTSPVEYTPPDFQYGEAVVAAPRAKAAPPPPPPPLPPAIKPNKQDPVAEALNARNQAESDAHKERMDKLLGDDQPLSAQDKWMALARAGFAAAAGSSPYALQNIGAGLSKGVESLDELRKERAINRMKQATLEQSRRSEELTSEDRKTTAGIQQQLADIQRGKLDLEKDPNSPDNKVKAAQVGYYGRAGIPDKTLFEQRRAAQQEVDAMSPGPEQDAAQKSLDRITGAEPKGMSEDAINKRIQEEAMAAYKDFERDWAGDIKNVSKTPEQKKTARDIYVKDRINQARNIFLPQGLVAPPPAGGGNPALEAALNNYK